MRSRHLRSKSGIRALSTTAIMLTAVCSNVHADATPKPGSISVSGLADFYYAQNFNDPYPASILGLVGGGSLSIDNVGRSFDVNNGIPSLSLFEVDLVRTEGKGIPFGLTATLTAGDTAKVVEANEPGGQGWEAVQQIYATKSFDVMKHDVTVDVGKFVTPFGQEVIESNGNDEYSRGFDFQYAIPFYHFGIRTNTPINSQLNLYAALVNGWNDVADDNGSKSGILQLTWTPNSLSSYAFGWMTGNEGTGAYGTGIAPVGKGNIDTNLFEFLPTYQVTPKLKLAGELDYGQGAGNSGPTHISGDWLAMAGYAKYQLTANSDLAMRIEQFEDQPGAGGISLRLGMPSYTKLREITVTYEHDFFKGNVIARLEYRHDHSSQPFFLGSHGSTSVDQDTLEASAVVKF